tara:strand:- start:389 stop:697 length:309 start_codon:yes stop_codon:yes gene_type:complete
LQIKKVVSDIFLKRNLVIEDCLITITKVNLTSDLRFAKIYISIYNVEEKNKNKIFLNIKSEASNIKYLLGKKLNSKYVPNIEFVIDNDYEKYDQINKILKNG